MGIKIREIIKWDGNYAIAILNHGSEEITAKVWDKLRSLKKIKKDQDLLVELNYDRLIEIKVITNFNDSESEIVSQKDYFSIKGRVIQLMQMENDVLIDLYLQTGPEFISILKSEIGDLELEKEQGVEIRVTDLKFYPTNYE